MRGLILSTAALALALPSPAFAEACPAEVGPKFEKSLGDVGAWLNDDEAVYRPSGVRKLGVAVRYVIVDRVLRWNGDGYDNVGIGRLRYRLENVRQSSDGQYPGEIRAEFDRSYPGSGCGASAGEGCTATGTFEAGIGKLAAAALSEGDLYIRSTAYGPALDLVRGDYEAENGVPGFLVCDYRVES